MSYTVYNHRYIVNAAVHFREDILFGPSLPALICTSEIRSHLVIVPRNEGDHNMPANGTPGRLCNLSDDHASYSPSQEAFRQGLCP